MNKIIALYTFGMFIKRADHPDNDGFHRRNDPILALIEDAPGYIARSGYDGDPGPESWGLQVYPRFYREKGDLWSPSTLSLWQDLESIMAFSYFGLHGEAFSHGRDWFQKSDWPPYVAWWVNVGHRPDWAEGVKRHEFLHDNAQTANAFDFKKPYNAEGLETQIDRHLVKKIVAEHK